MNVTFSPTATISVDTGKKASSRAPFRYSVSAGPRTFEMLRANRRGRQNAVTAVT